MKKTLLNFLAIVLSIFLIVGCGHQTRPSKASATPIPTKTLMPTVPSKPTATFMPTFTPSFPPLPTLSIPTLTPLPKDIFDNFQGLSGNCRIKIESETAPTREGIGEIYFTNININFDRQEYFIGDLIKLSASVSENDDASTPVYGMIVNVIVEDPALGRHSLNLYDDGAYGDEKADDGVYTSIFDNTLNTGVYKFYFQLVNRNKSTGETFTGECFLAKTVKNVPVTAEEYKSCRRLEASAPIVVRAEDTGGNDNSLYGRRAFYPKAVSMGTSVLAVWQAGFDDLPPKPNAYMRLLDADVHPVGDVKLLFERYWVGQSYSLVKKDDYAVLTYCGRYEIGVNFEDRITSAFLDSNGNLVSEQVRSPSNRDCSYTGGEAIWTGSRMLFAWPDVNSLSFNRELLLDVADTDGSSLSWKPVSTDANAYPRFAIGHGRIFMVVTDTLGNSLAVHRFDLDGNELGEPAILSPLTYEVNGKMVVGGFASPYIVVTANGWMILAFSKPGGIYVAHLTPDGQLVSEPFITGTTQPFTDRLSDVLPYKGGAIILYDGKVLFLSSNGIIYQQWPPRQYVSMTSVSLFEHQGRAYLIYSAEANSGDPNANQVLVRELQCSP